MRENFLALCTDEQRRAWAEGFAHLRAGEFFAAHERFEEGFRAAEPPVRTALRALAQLAASHHQLSLGRGSAAVRTWHRARAKLESVGLLAEAFCAEIDSFHARLGLGADGPRFIDPARLGPADAFPIPVASLDGEAGAQ